MKTATSLTVIAIGAILAFAITTTPGFLNLQIVGWILMATGVIGLTLSRNNREWLRRTVIVRSAPSVSRSPRRRSSRPRPRPRRQLVPAGSAQPATMTPDHPAPTPAGADQAAESPSAPTEEIEPVTIEEYLEQ
jgi:hypothetical protein